MTVIASGAKQSQSEKMKHILETYTSYNLWANKRIAEMLSENKAAADKEIKSSFPSLKKTLCHIWGAEELWQMRLRGESLLYVPGFDFSGSIEEAIEKTLVVSATFKELVAEKDETYLQTLCTYKDTRGNTHTQPHWQMIIHCMNHSTYHRGQIITMLREAGATKIMATDMIVYFREKK